jgi:hypothetical protein
MIMLAPPLCPVKPARRPATAAALARTLDAAYRRLERLIPAFHRHPAKGDARGKWLERTWFPAGAALDRAENALLAHMNRRDVAGVVAGGRLYLDLCYLLGDVSDYRGTGLVAVDLAEVPDLAGLPTEADREWAAQQHEDREGLTDDEAGAAPDEEGPRPSGSPWTREELEEAGLEADGILLTDPSADWPDAEALAGRQGGGHGFGPDWDARAAESATLDRYTRGCLLV